MAPGFFSASWLAPLLLLLFLVSLSLTLSVFLPPPEALVIPMACNSGLTLLPDIPGLSGWGEELTLGWSGHKVREKTDPQNSYLFHLSFLPFILSYSDFSCWRLAMHCHGNRGKWQFEEGWLLGPETCLGLCQQDIVYQLDPGFAESARHSLLKRGLLKELVGIPAFLLEMGLLTGPL